MYDLISVIPFLVKVFQEEESSNFSIFGFEKYKFLELYIYLIPYS